MSTEALAETMLAMWTCLADAGATSALRDILPAVSDGARTLIQAALHDEADAAMPWHLTMLPACEVLQ